MGATLACSICLYAADFWQSKPFAEWSEKDAQRMVENSPWSKAVSVGLGTDGPAAGKGGRRGASGMGETASDAAQSGRMNDDPMGDVGGRGSRNRVGEESGPVNATTLTVRWQSALPVREALVKLKYGKESATSPEAKKFLEAPETAYVVAVGGIIPGMIRGDNESAKKALMEQSSLAAKGKDALRPADIQVGRAARGTEIYFVFPKSAEFSVDDKEIEFATKIGSFAVRQKFKLKDMMFEGKLAL